MEKPRIAIIGENALENLGLKTLLEKIFSFAEVTMFSAMEDVENDGGFFFHYFITPRVLLQCPSFFDSNKKKTIVLTVGGEQDVPACFHQIDVSTQQGLLKELLQMAWGVHHNYEKLPLDVVRKFKPRDEEMKNNLTKREAEVLKYVAMGKSSKEIAGNLNISLSTVLSHRKNLMDKLNVHSATKLVVYAVMHGFVKPDEIG